jgi:hypothetical protein
MPLELASLREKFVLTEAKDEQLKCWEIFLLIIQHPKL